MYEVLEREAKTSKKSLYQTFLSSHIALYLRSVTSLQIIRLEERNARNSGDRLGNWNILDVGVARDVVATKRADSQGNFYRKLKYHLSLNYFL